MNKLKKFLVKYWALITFIISFVIDSQYQILENLINDAFWVNIIKGLFAALLAYMTGKGAISYAKDGGLEDDEDGDIGGGGIKNPNP